MKVIKKLLWFGALALALTGITLSAGAITYCFFWAVLAVPAVCYAYIFYVIFSLKIYQKTEGRNMTSGSPSDFYITLQNEGWFAITSVQLQFFSSFSTISGITDDVVYELMPHQAIRKKTQLLCRYRGEYEVGVKRIIVRDFLGLFSIAFKMREPLDVIVAPARVSLLDQKGEQLLSVSERESRLRPNIPSMTVREYVPGDDPRLLHWNATAAAQKLMVREMTAEAKNRIAILVDKQRPAKKIGEYLPPENKIVEMTVALTEHYLKSRIPVDVYFLTDHVNCISVCDSTGFGTLYQAMIDYLFREDITSEGTISGLLAGGNMTGYKQILWIGYELSEGSLSLLRNAGGGEAGISAYLVEKEIQEAQVSQPDRDTTIIRIGWRSLITEVAV